VIVALTTTAARAAKTATETIPIVFLTGADPVQAGLVVSLNHPGGNLTGVGSLISEVAAKRLELLHQLLPATTLVAYLANPTADADFAVAEIGELGRAAQALSLDLLVLNASSENEIDAAFETLVIRCVGGLIVSGDPLFNTQRDQLAALAMRHAVPMLCQNREQVAVGGLMGYGASILDAYHLAGVYTGRILKGEKPANLPVQQPTKFELVINVKTAKALGIEVPPNLLALADEVIE
jgi:putative ABC transport system substrate-binding protein